MRYLLLLMLAVSLGGKAAPMDPVAVGDKLWLQPKTFGGVSWADITGICNPISGLCNGVILGQDVTGWYWAGIDEVNQLFNHYLAAIYPGVELGPGPDSVFGIEDVSLLNSISPFYEDFETTESGYPYIVTSGLTRYQQNSLVYEGEFFTMLPSVLGEDIIAFGAGTRIGTFYLGGGNSRPQTITDPGNGLWLYRPEVPSPATLWLVVLALAVLRCMRRTV